MAENLGLENGDSFRFYKIFISTSVLIFRDDGMSLVNTGILQVNFGSKFTQ